MATHFDRRNFLKTLGLGTGALGAVSLTNAVASETIAKIAAQQEVDWQKIDADHEARVQTFLGNIGAEPNFGGNPLITLWMATPKFLNSLARRLRGRPKQVDPSGFRLQWYGARPRVSCNRGR